MLALPCFTLRKCYFRTLAPPNLRQNCALTVGVSADPRARTLHSLLASTRRKPNACSTDLVLVYADCQDIYHHLCFCSQTCAVVP
jgi:hypothetical protein